MPYTTEHQPSFDGNRPSDDQTVWRYMDLARFLSMLEAKAIHFARADQMSDKWEGSYSPVNVAMRPALYGEHYEQMFNPETRARNRQISLQSTHMSCWHLSDIESAAMWDIYLREGMGVAVKSTWGDLTGSISTDRLVFGGKIHYEDSSEVFIPEDDGFAPFMYKRGSFSHEQEVRLMFMSGKTAPHPEYPQMDVRTGPEDPVIPITADIARLVSAIYVSPEAPTWITALVQQLVTRYGYAFPVRQSDLSSDGIA